MKISEFVMLAAIGVALPSIANGQDDQWRAYLGDADVVNMLQEQISIGREQQNANYRRSRELLSENLVLKSSQREYYGSVHFNPNDLTELYWAAGQRDAKASIVSGANMCGKGCKLLVTFSDSCVMFAEPRGNSEVSNIVYAIDDDPERVIEAARQKCQAANGVACDVFARPRSAEHPSYCVGYRYGIYS